MTIEAVEQAKLERIAHKARQHIVGMSTGSGCFLGASLSCVDILVSLYADTLRIAPELVEDENRDVVLLSKGHAVPALYAVLAEMQFFPAERLLSHMSGEDLIYWHPNPGIAGVEFQSGSLGHLLSVGIGIALDARLRSSSSKVVVVAGDGELNEGSMWEGVLVARAQELNHLYLIIDRNRLQANVLTEDLVPLEPLTAKFDAFGWNVVNVDGHSFPELRAAISENRPQRPTAIIANTVRGRGLSEHEGRVDKWFVKSSSEQAAELLRMLERNQGLSQ